MQKVLIYSLLLLAGLLASQALAGQGAETIRILTMVALSFIMIHVGYEFEVDRSALKSYAVDSLIAFLAASVPWILCAFYFVYVMHAREEWGAFSTWKGAFLQGLFAAPTSAGVLFSMLAAAGLGATWVFKKARILAIFDDLSTILMLIPLKGMIIGVRWQLLVVLLVILALLWVAWRYLHRLRIAITWPWVIGYSGVITAVAEGIYYLSKQIDPDVPVHLEVLLPAFALGCVMARPPGADPHADDALEEVEEGPESPSEQRVSTLVSALFMVLVGLSMPPILNSSAPGPGWGVIALHVLAVTLLSNIGKMLPAVCYRREATLRERLGLAIGMFPRGEVGAGVLVVSLSYNITGPTLTVAVLSLAVNLVLTGVFILIVKRLLEASPTDIGLQQT